MFSNAIARTVFPHSLPFCAHVANEITYVERTKPPAGPGFCIPAGRVWYDWLRGWMADRWPVVTSEMARFGERPERTCHVSFAGLETHRKTRIRERRETANLRERERERPCIMCDALCESIHTWLPSGLSRASACAICCFHCSVPVALCSVFMRGSDLLLSSLVWFCFWLLRKDRSPIFAETSAYTSGFIIVIAIIYNYTFTLKH